MSGWRGLPLVVTWMWAVIAGAVLSVVFGLWAYQFESGAGRLLVPTAGALIAVVPTALVLRQVARRACIPWLLAGAGVAIVLWLLGLAGLRQPAGGTAPFSAAALSGLENGIVIGVLQGAALWRALPAAYWWLPTRMLAGLVTNLAGVYLSLTWLAPTTFSAAYAQSIALGVVAGVLSGLIQGFALNRLLSGSVPSRRAVRAY